MGALQFVFREEIVFVNGLLLAFKALINDLITIYTYKPFIKFTLFINSVMEEVFKSYTSLSKTFKSRITSCKISDKITKLSLLFSPVGFKGKQTTQRFKNKSPHSLKSFLIIYV